MLLLDAVEQLLKGILAATTLDSSSSLHCFIEESNIIAFCNSIFNSIYFFWGDKISGM